MTDLTQAQIDQFWRDGFLQIADAVSPVQLADLRKTFAQWVEDSRAQTQDYGETQDGRARFDLQPGHSAQVPGLRRVQSPEEVSEVYADVMRQARTVDWCAQLIGPGLRFHHGKINSKLPGTATQVKWHQDFPFEPMSNDDLITCLLFVDEVTQDNGPLEVLPGSHKGPIYSHWRDGAFVGAVDEAIIEAQRDQVRRCTGAAGSVCLMHSRLLHGSAPNLSDQPRTLYISLYYAEDALPLTPNPLPNRFANALVRGQASGRVRCSDYEVALPELPKGTSFFAQQETLKH